MVSDELLGHMYDMIRKVDIDMDGARKYLDEAVDSGDITKYKATLEWEKCVRIHDKSDPHGIFVSQDSYGRVHSNFTNISKHIREKFLYLDGERLIGLDIISSQAALLGTLFREYFTKIINEYENYRDDMFHMSELDISTPVDVREKYVNSRNKYTGAHIYANEFKPLRSDFGYPCTLDMLEVAAEELKKYERILELGLYEFFQSEWEYIFDDIDRNKVKKEWISYVFGKKNSTHHEQMDILWKKEFPLLTKVLKHFKTGSHKLLAQELQRKESDLIFNELCPQVDDMGITYFTVHDSIVVKESVFDDVYDVFEEVLEENDIVTGVAL